MKVVVADTSPLNYLVLIDCIDLLRSLYIHVVIPPEVVQELTTPGAPPQVAAWMRSRPEWIEIRSPTMNSDLPEAFSGADLDPGELAAIQLALGEEDVLLLIDEATGGQWPRGLGLQVPAPLGFSSRPPGVGSSI